MLPHAPHLSPLLIVLPWACVTIACWEHTEGQEKHPSILTAQWLYKNSLKKKSGGGDRIFKQHIHSFSRCGKSCPVIDKQRKQTALPGWTSLVDTKFKSF